jgi:anti-sigma factor RsiW
MRGQGGLMNCDDVVGLSPLYLAGQLDRSRALEIRKHLERCATCASLIADQAGFDARLREAVLAEDLDTDSVNRRIRQKISGSRRILAGAGIAAAVLVALLGYAVWSNARVSRLYADAAVDHRREVIDHQPRTWVTDRAAIAFLAQRQGLPASTPARVAFAGYRLERGKLCRLAGLVYLHLVYSNGSSEVSVFLRQPAGEPIPKPIRSADRGEEHLASVKTDSVAAVVVTDQSGEAARQFAGLTASVL